MSKNKTNYFKNILLVGKYESSHIKEQLLKVEEILINFGSTVFFETETANNITIDNRKTLSFGVDFIQENIDLIIVLGGDGTMLGVSRNVAKYGIPIAGINLGTLGFLTSIAFTDVEKDLGEIIHGQYNYEYRMLIEGTVYRHKELIYSGNMLNDLVIRRGNMGSMLSLQFSVNDKIAFNQKSDGIIFATPTGSTAYALSAGGSILHPEMQAISLIPICPQTISNRPIILPNDVIIKTKILQGSEIAFHMDGQDYVELTEGDEVMVRSSIYQANFIHTKKYNYCDSLREKLFWNFDGNK